VFAHSVWQRHYFWVCLYFPLPGREVAIPKGLVWERTAEYREGYRSSPEKGGSWLGLGWGSFAGEGANLSHRALRGTAQREQ